MASRLSFAGVLVAVVVLGSCSWDWLLGEDKKAGEELVLHIDEVIDPAGGAGYLDFDPDGNPHVVYVASGETKQQVEGGPIRYAYRHGTTWYVENTPGDGSLPALALGPDEMPHIVYNRGGGSLYYMSKDSNGEWYEVEIDSSIGAIGQYVRMEVRNKLRIDTSGRLHLAYYRTLMGGTLMYGLKDEYGWTFEEVGRGLDAHEFDLDLNSAGAPWIAFHDGDHLAIATRGIGPVWPHQDVFPSDERISDSGIFPSLAVNGLYDWSVQHWHLVSIKDEYGGGYDVPELMISDKEGSTVMLSGYPEEGMRVTLRTGPTDLGHKWDGALAQVYIKDCGVWGMGGRIPMNMQQCLLTYSFTQEEDSGAYGFVFEHGDGSMRYRGDWGEGGDVPANVVQVPDDVVQDEPDVFEGADTTQEPPEVSGWQTLGSLGFSGGAAYGLSMAMTSTGPVVAWRDGAKELRTSVARYEAGNWTYLGMEGFTKDPTFKHSVATYEDKVSLAVVGQESGSVLDVQAFGAAGWLPVGSVRSTVGYATQMSFAVMNAIPYLAVAYTGDAGLQMSLLRYIKPKWVFVGDASFAPSSGDELHLVMGPGFAYVAFVDHGMEGRVTVMRCDLTTQTWSVVGDRGLSESSASSLSLTVLGYDIYIAYSDSAHEGSITVQRYNGTNWSVVGTPGFYPQPISYTSIAADIEGPVVAFKGVAGRAIVQRFNGSTWLPVGDQGIASGGDADEMQLLLQAGRIYLAYSDFAHDQKLTVRKWAP